MVGDDSFKEGHVNYRKEGKVKHPPHTPHMRYSRNPKGLDKGRKVDKSQIFRRGVTIPFAKFPGRDIFN